MASQEARSAHRRLMAWLGTAKIALSTCVGPEHALLSKTQADAVVELANLAQLCNASTEEKANVLDAIMSTPWHGEDRLYVIRAALVEAPSPAAKAKPEARPRRQQQQYMPSVLSYLTHDQWQLLHGPRVPIALKMEVIFNRLTLLGARNLTEPCKKYLAAVCLYLTFGTSVFAVPNQNRLAVQKDIKSSWERWARRNTPRQEHYLAVLPALPETLRAERPDLWDLAFRDQEPEVCRIDLALLRSIDNLMSCRRESSGFLQMIPALASAPHSGTGQYDPETPIPELRMAPPARSLVNLLQVGPAAVPGMELARAKESAPAIVSAQPTHSLTAPRWGPQMPAPPTQDQVPSPCELTGTLAMAKAKSARIATAVAKAKALPMLAYGEANALATTPSSSAALASASPPMLTDGEQLSMVKAPSEPLASTPSVAPMLADAPANRTDTAAGMLEDFLTMATGRKRARSMREDDGAGAGAPRAGYMPVDDGVDAGAPHARSEDDGADAGDPLGLPAESESPAPRGEPSAAVKVQICHESTRNTWRVRWAAGAKKTSKGFPYKTGDAVDKERARKEATDLATQWEKISRRS